MFSDCDSLIPYIVRDKVDSPCRHQHGFVPRSTQKTSQIYANEQNEY